MYGTRSGNSVQDTPGWYSTPGHGWGCQMPTSHPPHGECLPTCYGIALVLFCPMKFDLKMFNMTGFDLQMIIFGKSVIVVPFLWPLHFAHIKNSCPQVLWL